MCIINGDGPLLPCFNKGQFVKLQNELLRHQDLKAHLCLRVLPSHNAKLPLLCMLFGKMLPKELIEILFKLLI